MQVGTSYCIYISITIKRLLVHENRKNYHCDNGDDHDWSRCVRRFVVGSTNIMYITTITLALRQVVSLTHFFACLVAIGPRVCDVSVARVSACAGIRPGESSLTQHSLDQPLIHSIND